jgi:hypothetical protein
MTSSIVVPDGTEILPDVSPRGREPLPRYAMEILHQIVGIFAINT